MKYAENENTEGRQRSPILDVTGSIREHFNGISLHYYISEAKIILNYYLVV